jgi:uncharacterized protein YdeI (YjbR/CyaY-like superfamily)
MAAALITVDVRARQQWRAWLANNHASRPGIRFVRHKQHTGVKSMPHEAVVREALCFGWIDSLLKRLDDDRYAIKVTPRAHEHVVKHQPETLERTTKCAHRARHRAGFGRGAQWRQSTSAI